MKKAFVILFFFLLFSVLIVNSAEARSGCCSHHGGVCGCGCCDGSDLSATCAPYYPECNSGNSNSAINELITEQKNENSNQLEPAKVTQQQVTPQLDSSIDTTETENSDDWLGWFFLMAVVGVVGYRIGKNKK